MTAAASSQRTGSALPCRAKYITSVTDLPLIADSDNGYGNALNTMRTVKSAPSTIVDASAPSPPRVWNGTPITDNTLVANLQTSLTFSVEPELQFEPNDGQRIQRALEVFVYAPLGLGLWLRDLTPSLIDTIVAPSTMMMRKRCER